MDISERNALELDRTDPFRRFRDLIDLVDAVLSGEPCCFSIRIAPVPLTTSCHEVWQVVQHLKEIVEGREYERFGRSRKAIS